ncbi:U3 small nucleolar ribonucleoprotein protein MPP10-like [Limulus polyphemus]|uniref:U3 small nucleolar ribonucleoprotein protein MPP10-like n=1 Tax=Limulus polyphemus TaxID=6850 RepID=A0ABM1B3P8_LIMPO|nr:U3 small nucleolar ribonucleoprotein protein MPP10-like [Limulus polyphemus]
MMTSLFAKLDALSNFHYTPKPRGPELKIISNLPAVTVEEVAPTAVSDLTLLAPEEVKARPKGEVKSNTEKTNTDRKRDRRQKKLKQRQRKLDRESREKAVAKLNPGLGNKYSKIEALKKLKHVKDVTVLEDPSFFS